MKNNIQKSLERFEKEIRLAYKLAASSDDRSDFDCAVSVGKSFLKQEIEKARLDTIEEAKKMFTSKVAGHKNHFSIAHIHIYLEKLKKEQ